MANKACQEEAVLVIPRDVLDSVCLQTFCRETSRIKSTVLSNYRFIGRSTAEQDFRFKQVIPYVMIRHRDRYLLVRRTTKQAEARLHDMYSLGIGGHVNDEDSSSGGGDIIMSGMRRELDEEIRLDSEESCTLFGIINDDSTEVARVHVGFVFLLTTASPHFTIVEQDKFTAAWKLPGEITQYYGQMESWAQIVHDYVLFSASPDLLLKWEVAK